jgi:hypothetical protein
VVVALLGARRRHSCPGSPRLPSPDRALATSRRRPKGGRLTFACSDT